MQLSSLALSIWNLIRLTMCHYLWIVSTWTAPVRPRWKISVMLTLFWTAPVNNLLLKADWKCTQYSICKDDGKLSRFCCWSGCTRLIIMSPNPQELFCGQELIINSTNFESSESRSAPISLFPSSVWIQIQFLLIELIFYFDDLLDKLFFPLICHYRLPLFQSLIQKRYPTLAVMERTKQFP